MKTATLLVKGPDRKGIIATITNWIYKNEGNIVYLDQHTDPFEKMFFMRVEFEIEETRLDRKKLVDDALKVCHEVGQEVQVYFSDEMKKVAILASKQPHCLFDLLHRFRSGEFKAELKAVISNHPDHEETVKFHNIPYYYLPVTPETKKEQEKQVIEVLKKHNVDTIVLARYMQILSPDFVKLYPNQIINIHHSFLPAFVGADPYYQAYKRGVKLIGATAHYVTEELDQGPIIAQGVIEVSHRDSVEQMRRKGKDIEVLVLARAVKLHIENKIIVHNGKTIVFSD
ncbi:MAG: formyltetrahydrofolate deformylase [Actinobacteria bacterium]|nr:formyltetrahydrofolate deformylase [Actinomycetota bacterium]